MIYLDNAATSFPKPDAVYASMDRFLRESCANPGRSGHRMAMASQKIVSQCRQAVADLLGAASSDRVIFTLNATDALNIALKGVLRPGDHVVTTSMEHNSVIRPLRALEGGGVSVTVAEASSDGVVGAERIHEALRSDTRLVAMTHVSNVVGTLQPVAEVAAMVRDSPTLLLVDAAQSAGAQPIHVERMGIDLLAFAGHKGVLGPPGTGGLVLGLRAEPEPLREGGTGTRSESPAHPRELPERLEAGTLNVSGLAGLLEGTRYLLGRTVEDVSVHERRLAERLHRALADLPRVVLYGPGDFARRGGVVSFNVRDMDPREVAAILDAAFGIATRAGLHCAPLAHHSLGTMPNGTVRVSVGPLTTDDDITHAIEAVAAVAQCT